MGETMLATLALMLAAAPVGSWNLEGPAPHLIFHYMPWFATDRPEPKMKVWQHWAWGGPGPSHDPSKRLSNGRRDIASVYYPLIGPYTTADRNVVRYHMRTIRAAGGEAVAIDWYGPDSGYDARMP